MRTLWLDPPASALRTMDRHTSETVAMIGRPMQEERMHHAKRAKLWGAYARSDGVAWGPEIETAFTASRRGRRRTGRERCLEVAACAWFGVVQQSKLGRVAVEETRRRSAHALTAEGERLRAGRVRSVWGRFRRPGSLI